MTNKNETPTPIDILIDECVWKIHRAHVLATLDYQRSRGDRPVLTIQAPAVDDYVILAKFAEAVREAFAAKPADNK